MLSQGSLDVPQMYCSEGCFFGHWYNNVFTWMVCASSSDGKDSGVIHLGTGQPRAFVCTGDRCVNDTR